MHQGLLSSPHGYGSPLHGAMLNRTVAFPSRCCRVGYEHFPFTIAHGCFPFMGGSPVRGTNRQMASGSKDMLSDMKQLPQETGSGSYPVVIG